MDETGLSSDIADQMVEMSFRETPALSIQDVLVVGPNTDSLVSAIERYTEKNIGSGPTVYAPEGEILDTRPDSDSIRRVEGDFLSERFTPDRSFDFVIGNTPKLDWRRLDEERRREYASLSPYIRPDDSMVNWGLLYIERSRHHLKTGGRTVLLAETDLKTSDETREFRGEIAPLIRDIEDVEPDLQANSPGSQLIAVLELQTDSRYDLDDRASWADPAAIERRLASTGDEYRAGTGEAAEITTPLEEMDVYASDDDAPFVYLDMLFEDYDGSLVYGDPEERSGLEGYISRAELKVSGDEPIVEHAEAIPPDRSLPPEAPIVDVVHGLAEYRFVFVGTSEIPRGIITRYDLNRLPVYHWLYGRFVRLEIGLRNLLRTSEWPMDTTSVRLPSQGVGDLVPDELSNVKMSDLIELVEEAGLQDTLTRSQPGHEATLDDLRRLRNTIAHSNPIVHTMGDRRTMDDPERGAPQLAAEVQLLEDTIGTLQTQ